MPELPEVEVVKLSLERRLVGRRFSTVSVHSPALREPLDKDVLGSLAHATVRGLRRRAKYLLIDLDGGRTLVIHLGMSGRLTVVPSGDPRQKHEHLSFSLSDGGRLRLVDPRRFGMAFALPTSELDADRRFAHLGIEPLGADLTGEFLRHKAAGRRGPIKGFLMDGKIVVGVGNIYACEVLWRSKVHPKRSVGRVGCATWQSLAGSIQAVLSSAIKQGGTTLSDFQDGEGNAGYFQVSLAAYGRESKPCSRCGAPIRRIVQGNRSTFYCPRCQR